MINIKEEFLTHEKLVRAVNAAGYEVVGIWLAIKSHVGTNLTDGFIAEEDLVALKLPKPISPKKRRDCICALVECGKKNRDGSVGPGLLEVTTGGYEMHDYLDHSYAREQVDLLREKARLKKAQQRSEAKLQLELTKNKRRTIEDGSVPANVPRGHGWGHTEGTQQGTVDGTPPGTSRDRPGDAQTQPNPTQPNPKAASSQPPRNLEAALNHPVMQRAQLLIDHEQTLVWVQPQKWPELQKLGADFARSARWHEPRWSSPTGKAVMPLVRLLAEFTETELSAAVVAAQNDEWLRGQGFSTLTDEVVRRLLQRTGRPQQPASVVVDPEEVRERQEATKRELRANLAAQHAKLQAKAAG